MRNLATVLIPTVAFLIHLTNANACISRISERRYFVVNIPGTEVIRAESGDLIRLTLRNPVVPGKVQTRFDERVLRAVTRVNATPDGIVGAATNEYFFEVVDGGNTTIELAFVSPSGKVISGVKQEVQAKARPVTRAKCM